MANYTGKVIFDRNWVKMVEVGKDNVFIYRCWHKQLLCSMVNYTSMVVHERNWAKMGEAGKAKIIW